MTEIPPEAVEADRLEPVLLCGRCRSGMGGECHTPGCGLWMNRAPGVPVRASIAALPHIEQAIRADERRATVEAVAELFRDDSAIAYGPHCGLYVHEVLAREFGHKEDRP